MQYTFNELVGGLGMGFALIVVSYIAITTKSEVALGALLVVVSGGVNYFLRSKSVPPEQPSK